MRSLGPKISPNHRVAACSVVLAFALASPSPAFAGQGSTAKRSSLYPSAADNSTLPSDTATGPNVPGADDTTNKAERVNVESIKQKYWARGEESELGVVQNRLYSKEHKIEVSLLGGVVATDAFLSVQNLGASLGYHFSEYLSLHVIAWKDYVGQSSEFTAFQNNIQAQKGIPAVPDTNYPQAYYGGEGEWSLLYGKLSVLGKAIIYYDFHLLGGVGVMNTESGNDLTESLGLGQQFFLSKMISVRIDYRLMHYNEQLLNKESSTYTLGDTRANWTNAITLGVSFLIGFGK